MKKTAVSAVFSVLLSAVSAAAIGIRVSTFSADITVPLGHALMGGGIKPASTVVDPLLAKGVVLSGSGPPVVIAALDWCEVRNDAYDRWREVLAESAGTSKKRVLLACVHQHDAPVVDLQAQKLLDDQGLEKSLCDPRFNEEALQRVAAALRRSLERAVPVSHYGLGEAQVDNVASNRRVVSPEGVVSFARGSATPDPKLREAPVGTIDPWLKTVSFWNGDQPVVALSFYAVHPMSYYGKGGVSYDFVGMARERRQQEEPSVFQIYFSGCSGDVTAGKYNDGNPENRRVLADRIYQAVVRAWENTKRFPIEVFRFRSAEFYLPPRNSPGFTMDGLRATLQNPREPLFRRNLAALGISWRKRVEAGTPIDVPLVDFGRGGILLMPAESFVQYQLDAQRLSPGYFLAVAGYGECAPGYIPSKQAIQEGFIESHIWCWVDRGVDEPMRDVLENLMKQVN